MSEPGDLLEQSFFSHLIELRARLLRAAAALLVAFFALVPFANKLYGWLAQPLLAKLPAGSELIAIDVPSPFLTPVKLAFVAAVIRGLIVVIRPGHGAGWNILFRCSSA